jgi:hypothetical protein
MMEHNLDIDECIHLSILYIIFILLSLASFYDVNIDADEKNEEEEGCTASNAEEREAPPLPLSFRRLGVGYELVPRSGTWVVGSGYNVNNFTSQRDRYVSTWSEGSHQNRR